MEGPLQTEVVGLLEPCTAQLHHTRAAPGEMAFIFHVSLQVRRKVTDTEMRLNYIPSVFGNVLWNDTR